MVKELDPAAIFERAADEGERRLDQTWLELVATAFTAGFTIVFGLIALGIVESIAEPRLGELARLLGALAFGVGVVFLVVGRTELFSENFFDPIAAAFRPNEQRFAGRLARLWLVTLVLNLVGGAVMVVVATIAGTLPEMTQDTLDRIAEQIAHRPSLPTFTRAVIGGALVALLSFLTIASSGTTARILLAWMIGALLALGPFDHVVVSLLHIGFGLAGEANVGWHDAAKAGFFALLGNLVGGVGLVTLSHAAQAKSAERRPKRSGAAADRSGRA